MLSGHARPPRLLAFSDFHVAYQENREIIGSLRPESEADWLLVAGDVGERFADIEWALRLLSRRFATVVWAPGNHELWTHPTDQVQLRGEERYAHLVQLCRSLGVLTPEDPYPVWDGAGGPATIASLFLLYDYSFRPPGTSAKRGRAGQGIRHGRGVLGRMVFAPRSVSEPRRLVPGQDRADPATARGQGFRAACRLDGPLPAGPRADADAAVSRVRAVVRHRAHR